MQSLTWRKVESCREDVAADEILRQLRRHAPKILEDLRDNVAILKPGPQAQGLDKVAIERWADRHQLNAPAIVRRAWHALSWWATSPDLAARLGGIDDGSITNVYHGVYDSASYQGWCQLATNRLPAPQRETLAQWRRRTVALYRDAEGALEPHERRTKQPGRPGLRKNEYVLRRNAGWTALHHAFERAFSRIGRAHDPETAADVVRKGVRDIEQVLGLPRVPINRNESMKTGAD